MEPWKRRVRMGMVGGGQGAFIGWVHRMAANLDGQIEFCAGCFSRDPENTRITGQQLYIDPARDLRELAGDGRRRRPRSPRTGASTSCPSSRRTSPTSTSQRRS